MQVFKCESYRAAAAHGKHRSLMCTRAATIYVTAVLKQPALASDKSCEARKMKNKILSVLFTKALLCCCGGSDTLHLFRFSESNLLKSLADSQVIISSFHFCPLPK